MMRRTLVFLALSLLFPAHVPAQDAARAGLPASTPIQPAFGEKLHIAGIPNAGKINDAFFRGAQPRKQGLAELIKLGVSIIVDLRGEGPDKVAWERAQAESLGMRFVHIPVSGWSPPTDAQVAQFLALFREDPKQRIFLHCRFGHDRTGVFVAAYRMAMEKWSAEQAMKEMYFFGFNGFWHPAMKSFIREFPDRLKSSPSLTFFQLSLPQS
jgi:tyrosine-protein phosphatase SIW14